MTGNYDIQAGDGGTFIVRKYGTEWVRIAAFIPGEYTETDEAILGNADTLADALEALFDLLGSGNWEDTRRAHEIMAPALRAARRLP